MLLHRIRKTWHAKCIEEKYMIPTVGGLARRPIVPPGTLTLGDDCVYIHYLACALGDQKGPFDPCPI